MRLSALDLLLMIAVALIVVGVVGMARSQTPAKGELYAFCDTDWPEVCDQKALMLKDVCEMTVETYGGGDGRFSCAVVDHATRDAYMKSVDRDVYERTIEAWAAGR